MTESHGFWMTNHVANPVLRRVLKTPGAGPRLGRRLALIEYDGRRTGTHHELVAEYVRDGDTVWVVPGLPEKKAWWRNFRGGGECDVRLAGHEYHAHATAIDGTTPDALDAAARKAESAGAHVVVRLDLEHA